MRARPRRAAAVLLAALAGAAPVAAAAAGVDVAAPLEAPGQSWLIDHTRTELGGEFYRAFAGAWRTQPRGAVVISVEEQMAQPFAHEIRIWLGNRLLLQTQLYPNQRAGLARQAEQAADAAAARLRGWLAPREALL